jgi:hypothetical protein
MWERFLVESDQGNVEAKLEASIDIRRANEAAFDEFLRPLRVR